MGIIEYKDRRPRDWAYKAVFSPKDLPSLEAMARHIRETHDTDMIEDFNAKCEQKLTGENATINGIEIQTVTKSGDLVVNTGIDQCIKLIQGTSTNRWSHFGVSAGSTPTPAISDTALNAETVAHRVSLAWNEAVGMRMFFGGISSQTTGSTPGIVGEIGVYNGSAAGAILLNRSLFLANDPDPDSIPFTNLYTAPVVVSAVIEFCPMV